MPLHHAIDSVALNGQMIFGWGWCFSDQAEHAEIQLKLEWPNGSVSWLKCQSHIARVDVLESYPSHRQSVRSGFRFAATLDAAPANAEVSLHMLLHDGHWERADLPSFLPEPETGSETKRKEKNKKKELHGFFEIYSSKRKPAILLIDHAMGGGANIVSNQWLDGWLEGGQAVLVLRFNVSKLCYELQYRYGDENQSASTAVLKDVLKLLEKSEFSRIEVNSLVSYPDLIEMLKFIARQRSAKNIPVTYYVHDFHALCDSWSLLNQFEQFCELPAPAVCKQCIASRPVVFPSLHENKGIPGWRSQWKKFLMACDTIRFFSDSGRKLFLDVYKNTIPQEKYLVIPHDPLPASEKSVDPVKRNPFVVGVVGNISIAKGASLLRDMARLIRKDELPIKIVVIGNIETYEPSEVFFSTGSYLPGQLPALIKEHGVGLCFLPSICPETFSFVASEIMQLGMPLIGFNLGAQAERISAYQHGFIIEDATPEAALAGISKVIAEDLAFRNRAASLTIVEVGSAEAMNS